MKNDSHQYSFGYVGEMIAPSIPSSLVPVKADRAQPPQPARLLRLSALACLLLSLLAILPSSLFAQGSLGTSTIGGTVLDSSKLPIANATITLQDVQHGTTRTTTSGSGGNYLFTGILPGIYTVRAEQAGFSPTVIQNVQVVIDQNATVNLMMKVGSVSQSVQVTAAGATPLLDTTSNALGTVIDDKRVEQLPLNGRNFLQLGLLAAGSQQPTGSSDIVAGQTGRDNATISIAGASQFETSYLIDGIETRGSRVGNSSLNIALPAIDQFKIEIGFFMPDQGPNPGIVDVMTKGGTNSFHGEAYDYVRNTVLNATNYFATKPQILHRNQFGFALGGPVIIPRLFNGHNRLWFHANYEGTRQIQNFLSSAYTPTQDMLNGNFSAEASSFTIYNPYSYNSTTGQRSPFPGNVIPANLINPVAKKLLAYYLPGSSYANRPNNLSGYPRNLFTDNQFTTRVDTALTAKQSLFATVAHENAPVVNAGLMPLTGVSFPEVSDLAVLQHTWTISSRTVNIARIGFDRLAVSDQGEAETGPPLETQIGIPGTLDPHGIPGISLQGYSAFGRSAGVLGNRDDNYEFDDAFDYIRGAHSLAFGVGVHYHRTVQQNANANAVGNLNFQSAFTAQLQPGKAGPTPVPGTGSSVADFLLGMPVSGTVVGIQPMHYSFGEFFPYFQDTWKAATSLTINYGVSWYYSQVPAPQGPDAKVPHGFDFSTGLLQYAGLGQVSPQVMKPDRNNFTPRLGFVWQPGFWHNGVVRGGVGVYFGQMGLLEAQFAAVAPPFQNSLPFSNSPSVPMPSYTFANSDPSHTVFPVVPPQSLTSTYAASLPQGYAPFAVNPNSRTPYVTQWTFSIQQTLGANDLIEVDYLGNSGHRQENRYDADQCQVTASLYCVPNSQPFPHYQYVLYADTNGNISYEGATLKYEHHFSKGVTVLGHYIFSKTLSDTWETGGGTMSQIASCRRCDKGPVSYDVPQQVTVSALYQLPLGKGMMFGGNLPRAADILIGGWRIGAIGSMQTGSAMTVVAPNTTKSFFSQVRADRLCNNLNSGFSSHLRSNGYLDFNPACFASPAAGYFGTSARGVLFGPGRDDWDLSMAKDVDIREGTRVEVRGEFFNAMNHVNFLNPSGANLTTGSVNFGKVSAAADPRLIQISASLLW